MSTRSTRLIALVAMLVAVTPAAAVPSAAARPQTSGVDRTVTVMTRNLYLGTDLRPLFAAPDPFSLFAAAAAGYAQVEAGRPEERMVAIAEEIRAARPDVVAIQEGTLYRVDSPPDGPATPAEAVTHDLLASLVEALDGDYEVLAVVDGTDAELPAGVPPTRDIRLTDRIAVLARADGFGPKAKVRDVTSGQFAAKLVVPTVAGPIAIPRGWIAVDLSLRGDSFRVVATHLEAFADPIQVAQAQELLAGPAATGGPVVIAGDLNTRADGLGSATYGLLRAAGFEDAWVGPGGLTCCHAVNLLEPGPPLDKRIDLVLHRGGFAVRSASVVDGRLPSGHWRSDHAGVVATLELPR